MAAVNFERAWYQLKAHVASKRSHGAAELSERMAEIEIDCLIPEGDEGFDARPSARPRPADASPPEGRDRVMATR